MSDDLGTLQNYFLSDGFIKMLLNLHVCDLIEIWVFMKVGFLHWGLFMSEFLKCV